MDDSSVEDLIAWLGTASPLEGQRVEDVARAHTMYLAKVAESHPEAVGCQAGWHAMMAACMRPDVVGGLRFSIATGDYRPRFALPLASRTWPAIKAPNGEVKRSSKSGPSEIGQQQPGSRCIDGMESRHGRED